MGGILGAITRDGGVLNRLLQKVKILDCLYKGCKGNECLILGAVLCFSGVCSASGSM
jgi:hypothetical protein